MASTDALTLRHPRISPADGGIQEGPLVLPPLVLGAGVFGYDYNTASTLESDVPEQAIRLCFRYGITTLDTSPYYTTSEQVLGGVFDKIRDEFPRESYQIITKIGRYGRTKADFDYSAPRTRASVENSMRLMKTDYLDGVYAHDVEFVSEQIGGAGEEGFTVDDEGKIRPEDLVRWGLEDKDAGTIRGPGDEKILEAFGELFKLKKEGKIRAVGFSGYPLPTLLRIARLIAHHLEPIDIMQSYCHHTLQNLTLREFYPLFVQAGVKQILVASPLSMGVLRGAPPPEWHPISPACRTATAEAVELCTSRGKKLADVALGYGFSSVKPREAIQGRDTPSVVGLSTPEEVHDAMKVFHSIYGQGGESRTGRLPGEGLSEKCADQLELEKGVVDCFRKHGGLNWTWAVGV
ncbi:hypothetical protein JCM3774_000297 [Rhodotorula dairenensis]